MKTCRPSPEELERALWVAAYAKTVCETYIANGRPDPGAFMDLCSALSDLTGAIVGASEFEERAEELHTAALSGEWQDPDC